MTYFMIYHSAGKLLQQYAIFNLNSLFSLTLFNFFKTSIACFFLVLSVHFFTQRGIPLPQCGKGVVTPTPISGVGRVLLNAWVNSNAWLEALKKEDSREVKRW